jgi:hypothetical protein
MLWTDWLELRAWDCFLPWKKTTRATSPSTLALTSEADSQLICVGRKQELFPFYFIFITNYVPQT